MVRGKNRRVHTVFLPWHSHACRATCKCISKIRRQVGIDAKLPNMYMWHSVKKELSRKKSDSGRRMVSYTNTWSACRFSNFYLTEKLCGMVSHWSGSPHLNLSFWKSDFHHLVMFKSCFGHLNSRFVFICSSAESPVQVKQGSGNGLVMKCIFNGTKRG